MSRLDDLPPDQHAALSLLLRRDKSYAEVAALLGIPAQAVHDRAHAALAVLAPSAARELPPERRAEVGDYLLGQRTGLGERSSTRAYLESSAPAREWASAITELLSPLASTPLPDIPSAVGVPEEDIPAAATSSPTAETTSPPTAGTRSSPSPPGDAISSPAQPAAGCGPPQARSPLASSRVGGALLLAGIVAVVVVTVILLSGGGSSHSSSSAKSSGATGASGSASSGGKSSGGTAPSTAKATEDKRIALDSPNPASKAIGVAEVLSEGKTYAFYLAAEHLPPSTGFFYAVWLYNSPTSFQAVSASPPVGSNGHLQGGALLPANAGSYNTMILTKETSRRPTRPGPIVLRGPFALR